MLRARLRLFNETVSLKQLSGMSTVTASLILAPPSDNVFPVIDAPPMSRVVKWIAAATADAPNNAVVYWEPTVVVNWLNSGKTAEFTWQPTSELLADLPTEDVLDHVAWLKPLLSLLRRGLKLGLPTAKRLHRASYEEEWEWGPDVIE